MLLNLTNYSAKVTFLYISAWKMRKKAKAPKMCLFLMRLQWTADHQTKPPKHSSENGQGTRT